MRPYPSAIIAGQDVEIARCILPLELGIFVFLGPWKSDTSITADKKHRYLRVFLLD